MANRAGEDEIRQAGWHLARGQPQEAIAIANKLMRGINPAEGARLLAEGWLARGRADVALTWARRFKKMRPCAKADEIVNRASRAMKAERQELAQSRRRAFERADTKSARAPQGDMGHKTQPRVRAINNVA